MIWIHITKSVLEMFSVYKIKNFFFTIKNLIFLLYKNYFDIVLDTYKKKSLMNIDRENDERFTVKNKNKITLYTL